MRAWLLAIGILFAAAGARAADVPQYKPVPEWVKPIPLPDKPGEGDRDLLQVSQARFGDAGDEFYDERAFRIQDPGDLARLGNVVLTWSPETETLVLHKIEIIRDGKVIDQLDQGRTVKVLHRETNLERAMFDGALTATVQIEGLQVGDVVHLAVTRQTHDPVLKGHSQMWSGLSRPGKIGRAYISASWPAAKPLRWQASPGIATPRTATSKGGSSLVVDVTDAEAPLAPRGAPARFGAMAFVQMSDFASWSEVSALMAPLFDKASTLEPDSPLKAEIAKIKAQSSDPGVQAAAALKLVEDQIRYLFVGLNNGNLTPALADDTWRRRFGDCKAKTALLLALLKGLGIEAQPALVDTESGDALSVRLPSLAAFDHVAVKARIAGKTYWLDGTRLGDAGLGELETPAYHWMLPVQASGAQLEAVTPTPFTQAHFSTRLELDASAGLDAPAKAHGEHQWRGDGAETVRLKLQGMSTTERERTMRGYWQQAESWITASAVSMKDDGRVLTLVMDGTANMSWSADTRGRTFVVNDSSIGGDINFQRQPGPNADAPFAVAYPSFTQGLIKVTLPNKGQGFMLINGAAIDQVVAGAQYKRTARIEGGAALIETQVRTVAPEFPFSDAAAAASTLRTWGMHTVMIASNPALADAQTKGLACAESASPDDALKACQALLPAIATAGGDPAPVYFAMGRAYAGKGDETAALQNIEKALALRPAYADALAARGSILAARGDRIAAAADLNRAESLDPSDAYVLRLRAGFYLSTNDWPDAVADANRAIHLDPQNGALFAMRGQARRRQNDFAGAMSDYDEAIRLDPNAPAPHAYKADIYYLQKAFALAEQELSRSIAIAPKNPFYWTARGLLRADLKRWSEAVSDYDEALKLDPSSAKTRDYRTAALAGQTGKAPSTAPAQAAAGPPAPAPATTADQVRMLLASGKLHSANKEYGQAISDFDQALTIVHRHPDVLTERAAAYAAIRQWEMAVADYDQVLAMRPDDPAVTAARSAALAHLGRTAPVEKPASPAKQAEATDVTGIANTLLNQAREEMARKNYDAAIRELTAALTLRPGSPTLLKVRAEAHRAAKHYAAAVADYDGLQAINPNDTTIAEILGELDVLDRKWDRAVIDLTRALKVTPNSATLHRYRAQAYTELGETDKASADLAAASPLVAR